MYSFTCDYLEGCHPSILKALTETNLEQNPGYGEDSHCAAAADAIRQTFRCPEAAVHFLVGGTQVNTTVIAAALRPWEGVLAAETGHIAVHETGAIESSGHKVLTLPQKDGKITAAQIDEAAAPQLNPEHMVKPGMVYISLSTELGTLYTREELAAIREVCTRRGLYLYVDGARLGYALASPACDIAPEDLPRLCDAFTMGGTKQGALFGEALILTHPDLNSHFRHMIKQRGGMLAKGRLLGIQFEALTRDGLYFTLAREAVAQAQAIQRALKDRDIPLLMESPTNQIFPILTGEQMAALEKCFSFEVWEYLTGDRAAVRFCTSWATDAEAVRQLVEAIRAL